MLGNGLSRLIHGMIFAVYSRDFHFKVVKAKNLYVLAKNSLPTGLYQVLDCCSIMPLPFV